MTKTRVRGVYKHKSGGYIARLRRKGVSLSRTFASLTSAERWITQTRIGLDDGDLLIRNGEAVSRHEAERQRRTDLEENNATLVISNNHMEMTHETPNNSQSPRKHT